MTLNTFQKSWLFEAHCTALPADVREFTVPRDNWDLWHKDFLLWFEKTLSTSSPWLGGHNPTMVSPLLAWSSDLALWALTPPFGYFREEPYVSKPLLHSKGSLSPYSVYLEDLAPAHCSMQLCQLSYRISVLQTTSQLCGWSSSHSCLFPRLYTFVDMYLRLVPFHPVSSFLRSLLLPLVWTLCFPSLSTVYLFTWLWFAVSLLHVPSLKLFWLGWPASTKCSCPTLPELSHISPEVLDPQSFGDHKRQNLDVDVSLVSTGDDTSWWQPYTDQNDLFPSSVIRTLNWVIVEWQKA